MAMRPTWKDKEKRSKRNYFEDDKRKRRRPRMVDGDYSKDWRFQTEDWDAWEEWEEENAVASDRESDTGTRK